MRSQSPRRPPGVSTQPPPRRKRRLLAGPAQEIQDHHPERTQLTADQATAVLPVPTDGKRVSVISAPAGSGKIPKARDGALRLVEGRCPGAVPRLIATSGSDVAGYIAIVWESNYAGFRSRGIPLVHQVAVAGPFRRRGVATLLMDAAEELARDRGIATLGLTVGLFDEYGPAQRLYGRLGYIPDGRGACQGQRPLRRGTRVIMDDDLIIWLTKDLAS